MAFYKCCQVYVTANSNVTVNSSSGAIANFTTSLTLPLVSVKSEIVATGGGGTPQAPIAISGVSAVSVVHCGKNLFDKNNASSIIDGYIASSIVLSTNIKTVFTKCKPNTLYTVSKNAGQRFTVGYTTEFPADGVEVFGRITDNTGNSISVTTGQNAVYIVAYVYNPTYDSGTASDMIASVQIEEGGATNYEAYNGSTALINLGGTYYGGYVSQDKDGNRELVVTHSIGSLALGDNVWREDANRAGVFYGGVPTSYGRKDRTDVLACSCFNATNTGATITQDLYISGRPSYSGTSIFFRNSAWTGKTSQEVNTLLANETFVYELAEPFTAALPDGVPITAFNGVNNVWNDSGDTAVEYKTIQSV